jgi:glycosyltransferase involved in cell wall biosynthesis
MKEGCAIVNLPSFVKAYAGRVIEGMATGVPVISWEIPERPRTKSLFENGKEIMLYAQNDPSQLAEHIKKIQSDKKFSKNIVINARNKLKKFHTAEHRAKEILHWIETGETPIYE